MSDPNHIKIVTVYPDGSTQGKSVQYKQDDKSLLNCLEAHDVEVHYHCRDGFCGACRVKLKSGQVCYPNGEPLAFVADDEILPCCCIPHSDISIEVE